MSDQRRERQSLRDGLEAAHQLGQAQGLSPEIQTIQRMQPAARVCLYHLDLLKSVAGAMATQSMIEGAPQFASIFAQLVGVIAKVRGDVFTKESSGILIAQPGDLPPEGVRTGP